jgi:energy-coupling factor transport system substrate-specific component
VGTVVPVTSRPRRAVCPGGQTSVVWQEARSQWGAPVILQGLVQGLGAELVFAALFYRNFKLPVAILAGALTGVGAAIYDFVKYTAGTDLWSYRIPYAAITVVSGALLAGLGSWALVRALAPTGVLDRFEAGRERASV